MVCGCFGQPAVKAEGSSQAPAPPRAPAATVSVPVAKAAANGDSGGRRGVPVQQQTQQGAASLPASEAAPPKTPELAPAAATVAPAAHALNAQAGVMKVVTLLQELLTLTSERMQVMV